MPCWLRSHCHQSLERIQAHASLCLVALVIHRLMRQRLKLAGSTLFSDADLRQLRRAQRHQVCIDGAEPIPCSSIIHEHQAATLDAIRVKKPNLDAQISML